jgi:hypothetical protein
MTRNSTAIAAIATELSSQGSIAELRASLPEHALFHEIRICGGCDWATIVSIGNVLARSAGALDSLVARRYGAKGELTVCRVRDLDDANLHKALDEMRRLPGVRSVSVAHFLSSRPPRPDPATVLPDP